MAVDIASLPEKIRGYGHVKDRHLVEVEQAWEQKMNEWAAPTGSEGGRLTDQILSVERKRQ